jgi:cyclohexa-1,5-dienecarbonyl-CoA hydratase
MSDEVRVERLEDGRVLSLVFDRPKGNVFNRALMERLDAALAEHAAAPELKLVTLRGAGKDFSFGAAVEEHVKEQAPGMLTALHALVRRIGSYPVPVAALVDGRCLGGAFEIALACHFVIATPRAVFACPEIKLGVFPPVLAALGPLRLGAALAERLVMTGAEIRATEARDFVWLVTDEGQDLGEASLGWYRTHFAALSAFALRQATLAARRGSGFVAQLDAGIAEAERHYLESLLPSHDGNEGIAAFMQKRKPDWRDA